MAYDFATPVERRHPEGGWASQKWHRYGDDVLPLWVADMDFRSPPAVIDALQRAWPTVYMAMAKCPLR